MKNRKSLTRVVCLLGLTSFAMIATEVQVFAQPTRNDVKECMTQAILDEIKTSIEIGYGLEIEEQKEFFSLKENATKKLNLLAKRRSAEQMARMDTQYLPRMIDLALRDLGMGTTFSLNGSEHTLEGAEREDPFIELWIYPDGGLVYLRAQAKTLTLLQSLTSLERIQTVRDPTWVAILEKEGQAELSSYEEMMAERLRENSLDIAVAIVSEWLAVSPEQGQPLREWLEKRVEFDPKVELYESVKRALLKIKEQPTDLLTEDQQNSWRLMVTELMNR